MSPQRRTALVSIVAACLLIAVKLLAGIATLYTLFVIYALGLKFLLLGAILYAPGAGLYVWARREQKQRVFTPVELGLFLVVVLGAVLGIVFLATGYITL